MKEIKMRVPPTYRQLECERFIARFVEESGGVSPSLKEIAAGLVPPVTEAAARSLVCELIAKGRAMRTRNTRSIMLIEARA